MPAQRTCGRTADSPAAPELRTLLHLHMVDRGYSFARRGFVSLSLPLSESDVDGFAGAVEGERRLGAPETELEARHKQPLGIKR